jgi:hypothetical protein
MSVPTPSGGNDTELDELPPLDGGEDDAPPSPSDTDENLDSSESPGGLDDATGEDDEADAGELDLRGVTEAWLDESSDAADLNIGDDLGIDLLERSASLDADGEGPAAEDFGVGEGVEGGGLDSGEEGPRGADEELRDEDLPDLGEAEADEIDDAVHEADRIWADEPMGLKWALRPWSRVGAPAPLGSASAVACVARGALVAGRVEPGGSELLRLDLEGECQTLAAEGLGGAQVRALSVEGDLVAAIVANGQVFLSRNCGVGFDLLNGDVEATAVVLASAMLWVRTRGGDLYAAPAAGGRLERRDVGARVAALAPDGSGRVVVLVADEAGRPVGILRAGADGLLEREGVEGVEPCEVDLLAARGTHVAYATRRGVVRRGADGVWRTSSWQGRVVALACMDDDGALVAATYSDRDDTTGLVQVDDGGPPRVVALLGPPTQADIESDGRAVALAGDEPRGVVWVAGGFGVAAFSTR